MPMMIAKESIAKERSANFCEQMSVELLNGLVKVKELGKYGLARLTGELVCPCMYDEIETISDSFKIKIDQYWGVMDANGKILCPCNYTDLLQIDQGGAYCAMDEDVYYIRFKN